MHSDSTVRPVVMFWLHVINLLRLDAVENLLKCDGAIFDTIQVDEHQETCKTETRERELASTCRVTHSSEQSIELIRRRVY